MVNVNVVIEDVLAERKAQIEKALGKVTWAKVIEEGIAALEAETLIGEEE